MSNDELTRALAKVIADPGSVIPRHQFWRGEYETVSAWTARAVLASLPSLPGAKLVDTTPEAEVLEADDTVAVERLAHWLHGEFKVSQRPWSAISEPVQSAFRRSARALMTQLPELFR